MVTITQRPEVRPPRQWELASRIDAAAWGLFFVWVGYALLAGLSIGVGLLGVGIVTLLAQGARAVLAVPLEVFWILVGAGFVVGGMWNIFSIETPLAPILLLGVGAALLVGALVRREPDDD